VGLKTERPFGGSSLPVFILAKAYRIVKPIPLRPAVSSLNFHWIMRVQSDSNIRAAAFGRVVKGDAMIGIVEDRRSAMADYCRRFGVNRLELFGSAADGSWSAAESDFDFLVEFEPMSPSEHSKAYFGLWFALQDLFGRDIDLVEIGAVRNPYFVTEIEKTRRLLYAA
jgi:uncharacterized protein